MIEPPDYLALGSVVTMRGNSSKLFMVVGRALAVQVGGGEREYYDYSFVPYPEGLIGDAVLYGNHENIERIVYFGFINEADEAYIHDVSDVVRKVDLPKAQPMPIGEW